MTEYQVTRFAPGEEALLWQLYFDTTRIIVARDYTQAQCERWAPDNRDMADWARRVQDRNPFVARVNGQIVGFAELEHDGHIDHFYVHHEWQGRGVGRALYEAVGEEARRLGLSRLYTESSVTAMPFFLRQGFAIVEEQTPIICGAPAKRCHIQKQLRAPQDLLRDFPELTSERIILRRLTDEDVPALFAIFSHPEVMRYWSTLPMKEMSEAQQRLERAHEGYRTGCDFTFGVVLRETGTVIGTCSLHDLHGQCRRAEVGYSLGRPHWGNGYITEALTVLLDEVFFVRGFQRLEADIDPRNTNSARVLERLGFQREGLLRERWIVAGEVCDTAFYGLLKRDWDQRRRGHTRR